MWMECLASRKLLDSMLLVCKQRRVPYEHGLNQTSFSKICMTEQIQGFFCSFIITKAEREENDIGRKNGKEMEMKMREKEGQRRGGICSPAERKSP